MSLFVTGVYAVTGLCAARHASVIPMCDVTVAGVYAVISQCAARHASAISMCDVNVFLVVFVFPSMPSTSLLV